MTILVIIRMIAIGCAMLQAARSYIAAGAATLFAIAMNVEET